MLGTTAQTAGAQPNAQTMTVNSFPSFLVSDDTKAASGICFQSP